MHWDASSVRQHFVRLLAGVLIVILLGAGNTVRLMIILYGMHPVECRGLTMLQDAYAAREWNC